MYELSPGLIVSCQDTIDDVVCALMTYSSGAKAIRINGVDKVAFAHNIAPNMPIIGIQKVNRDYQQFITPNIDYVDKLFEAGAKYVAMGENSIGIEDACIKYEGKIIIDISGNGSAISAEQIGACAVTTALSGYMVTVCDKKSEFKDDPDFELVQKCSEELSIPVIAEGRYKTLSQVRRAIGCGAHSVCIGGAINRPDLLTKYFVEECFGEA